MKITNYKGIQIIDEISSRPHSDIDVSSHDTEYNFFHEILQKVSNVNNPVMIEIGSWWAFWSLVFRQKFPNGKNILVELGKRQLCIGLENFKMNKFTETHYWGGFFLNQSNTYSNIESNYNYKKLPNEYFDDSLKGNMTGPEIEFIDIYTIEHLDKIDMLHMDIQGSELPLIMDLYEKNNFILSEKIDNIVIATHSIEIHNNIKNILEQVGFKILKDFKFGTVGGDGMIIGTKN